MRVAVVAMILKLTFSHFLWMHTDEHLVEITFNELPGTAGPGALLDLVQNTTHVYVESTETPRLNLDTTRKPLPSDRAELIASFSCMPSPYVLELNETFGISTEGPKPALLKYYSSASSVTKPNDWVTVQSLAQSELEITLRDPYMNTTHSKSREVGVVIPPSNDQCPSGVSSFHSMACVVAVVRFKGQLLGGVNISTFTANGTLLNQTLTGMGVTIVQVPSSGIAYASVNYRELVSGKYDGQPYSYIDHRATTSAALQR
jgi:hypothetical protein